MAWQIIAAILGYLVTGRFLLFALGVLIGGLFTAAVPEVASTMETLAGWITDVVLGAPQGSR